MVRKRDRAFAAFGASLFLITSSALTIIVIVLLVQQHNDSLKSKPGTASAKVLQSAHQNQKAGDMLNDFVPAITPQDKLQINDIVVGTGATVAATDSVTADYAGAMMSDGKIFDSSASHGGPISFPLNQVIKGWGLGIPGMKVGGTRRLLIPAGLAYGANAPAGSGITANADLVFDVTITKIN
jgi:FKBP-type peptidyl-prolyl cis-trans isomerase